jgi:serine phosphatase RsbU (regulator of sigma subunit)
MVEYIVYELHIVDKDGIITWSSDYHLVGRHIEQDFSDFLPLLDFENGESDSMLLPYNTTTEKFYAGSRIMDKGAVIVSYDTAYMTEGILEYIPDIVQNRFIGQSGQMIVCDQTERIISDTNNKYTGTLQDLGLSLKDVDANTVFETVVNDETAFCMYAPYKTLAGTYTIVAVYPTAEALFSKQVAVYITLFMEIVVFAILFINIYLLTNHVVVENIHKINASLNEITNGNLDTVIDVRDSLEFDSLSDDINSTVKTLKEYIEDAKARIDKELHFAQTIQQSALPSIFPPFPNRKDFDIYATMVVAKEVGGDFYDFYLLEDNLLAFLIADVSGKSIPGAMFMMRSKSVLKNLSMHYTNVADIFTQANAQLCEGNDADMFVTSWMGIVDFKTGTLSFANAAHNAPLIRHANGQFEFLRSKPNLALAFMDDTQYQMHEYQLQPGDELFLYTDGVTEAENSAHEFFTDERLLNALNQNPDGDIKAYCSRVKASIDEFSGEAEQFDDITMLTLKFHTFDA